MRLAYVDPHERRGFIYRANVRLSQTALVQLYAHHVGPRLDPWLYRVTKGLYPRITGSVLTAPLTTTGARSGEPRIAQVAYFHDGENPVLMASNYGGPKHPQWYHNLKAHPDCELGGERFVAVEIADLGEYDRLFSLAELVFPGYRDYRAATTALGRRIPVFRLMPR